MSPRSLRVGALVACACFAPPPVLADEAPPPDAPYVAPDFMSAVPPLPADMAGGDVWRLDLPEALATALQQNLGIVVERKQVEIADLGIITAGAPFEPVLSAQVAHNQAVAPPATSVEGTVGALYASRTDSWSFAISQQLETGTALSLTAASGRFTSTLGTAVAPLDYTANVAIGITQPLLRGFSLDLTIPRLSLILARISSESERYKLAQQAISLVTQTEDAYWSVVQVLYAYDLELKATARARDQEALTQRQIAAGTLAPSELLSVQSQVAQHELALVTDEQQIEAACDVLRGIMNLPRDAWKRPILPTEKPSFATAHVTAEDELAIALKKRPDLAQVDLGLESSQLAIRAADNNKLPQINLGVTGQVLGENSAYGATLDQAAGLGAHAWGVSVSLAWTPLMRATDAQATIARRSHDQAVLGRQQLVQQIWLDVRAAVRQEDSTSRQVVAAAAARKLAEQALEVEQRKFLNGTSTNINVANLQAQLQQQQVAELSAVLAHRKATQLLLVATGRLLDERNVELGVAGPPKK